jgi:hypothetical protein
LLFIGNIHGNRRGFPTAGADLLHQFIQFFLIARGDGYRGALGRQLESAGTANALGGASDQCNAA